MGEGYRDDDRRVIPWLLPVLLVGLLAVFGGLYAATHSYASARIARDTRVEGVDVGGLRPGEARRTLAVALRERAAQPIVVSANGGRAVIPPAAAGLRVDVPATVERLRPDPSWDPGRLWDWFAGRHEYAAVVRVDEAALARAVAGFSQRVDDPAVEGAVRFDRDGARPRYPDTGTVVRRAAAASAVRKAFLHPGRPDDPDGVVALPTRRVVPRVGTGEVSRAMDHFANPAASGSVLLRLHGRTERVQPEVYLPALGMRRVGSRLRPEVDPELLASRMRPALVRITGPVRRPRTKRATPEVRPHPRVTVEARPLARLLLRAVTRNGAARSIDLDGVVEVAPALAGPGAP